ncbi:MAG: hypothetical protein AAB225_10590 [Acidobacteriota bacterium]
MSRVRLVVPVVCLWLAGCASLPDTYAPPMQRRPVTGPEPNPVDHYVTMSEADADVHFVSGISDTTEAATWRWTGPRAELIFRLTTTGHLRFAMDFAIPEMTFKQRGPVAISISINGRLLDKLRYEKGGQFHFEKPAPFDWLRTDAYNFVTLEIDKPWVSPDDGARLGIILTSAGFVQ